MTALACQLGNEKLVKKKSVVKFTFSDPTVIRMRKNIFDLWAANYSTRKSLIFGQKWRKKSFFCGQVVECVGRVPKSTNKFNSFNHFNIFIFHWIFMSSRFICDDITRLYPQAIRNCISSFLHRSSGLSISFRFNFSSHFFASNDCASVGSYKFNSFQWNLEQNKIKFKNDFWTDIINRKFNSDLRKFKIVFTFFCSASSSFDMNRCHHYFQEC